MEYGFIGEKHTPYTTEITQDEAKRLISLEKIRTTDEQIRYPDAGKIIDIPLISQDRTERFTLSVGVGKIDIIKTSNQLRTKAENTPLVRIDTSNTPHKTPMEP